MIELEVTAVREAQAATAPHNAFAVQQPQYTRIERTAKSRNNSGCFGRREISTSPW